MSIRPLLDRYLPASYRALFTDEFTWRDNPVLRREQQRESRRRDRALLLLVLFATMLIAFTAAVWALNYFHEIGAFKRRVPVVLGSSYPVAFFALFSSIHVWFVWHAAYRRSNYLLLQEYRQNSLATLLCTRIPPFQLLLMASVHPFRQGMFVALAGLPFYLWLMGLGGVSWKELTGLYVLFTMISFRPPRWSLPVFAGIPAEEILKRQRTGRPKTWGEWWLVNMTWLSMIVSWNLQWAFGARWLMKLLWPLGSLVAPSVYLLLPGFIFTWVLALVRFLWNPLPYFGYQLPPIAVVVPLYLFARLMGIWESSIQLRTGDADTSQSHWDLREYWRLRRIHGIVLPALLLGYLWKPYVSSGLTSVLLVTNGAQPNLAMVGLLYLTGVLAALVCWARAREISVMRISYGGKLMGEHDGEMREHSLVWEAWYIFSPAVTIYSLYLLASVVAGAAPLPPRALDLLTPLLCMTAAGAIYARGVPPGARNYLLALLLPLAAWLVPLGEARDFLAGISPLAGLLSLSGHTQRILGEIPISSAMVAPWYTSFALSLTVGLAANAWLARRSPTAVKANWGPGSIYSPLPNIIPSVVTGGLFARQRCMPAASSVAASAGRDAPPVMMEGRQEGTAESTPLQGRPFLRKKDTLAARRLIAWVQAKWDNALAIKEMRVLLRGHLGKDEQIAVPLVLFLLLAAALYRPDISSRVLEGPARLLFGAEIAGGGAIWSAKGGAGVVFGGMAGTLLVIVTLIAMGAGIGVCATAFGRERDKSTLGFVLVTPLPTRSILLGKYFGMLVPALIGVGIVVLWCALLCVPVAAEIGIMATLTGMVFAVSICLLLLFLGGALGLACSTIFRREADASGMAFLLLFGTLFGVSYLTFRALREMPDLFATLLAQWVWVLNLGLAAALLIPASLAFTHWRLSRARHGDVAFESAK